MTMLERMQKVVRGEASPHAIASLIGFTLASVEPGEVVIEFEATERHANPIGTLHGGVFCGIVDAASGPRRAPQLVPGRSKP